jgi:hypothetical protein
MPKRTLADNGGNGELPEVTHKGVRRKKPETIGGL